MVHVDVSIQHDEDRTNSWLVAVEVSTDGGPWKRLADFPIYDSTVDMNSAQQKSNARSFASAFIAGARYAGAEVRATSFGEEGV